MAAPKVQTIAQATKSFNPAFAGSKKVINKQKAGLGAKYDAQRSGIQAERGEGFNAINNQATGRGGSFSGIPVEEQARYLSTKFLPGMQQADYQQNEEGMAFDGQLAGLGKEQALGAIGRVDKQQSDLNSWNSARAGEKFQGKQNALNRAATAAEGAANRAAAARQGAANRAQQNQRQTVDPYDAAFGLISKATGKDGYVSSGTFRIARDAYVRAGGNSGKFSDEFWKYTGVDSYKNGKKKEGGGVNSKNWAAYYNG